jgi:hypothetical protein
MFKTSNESISRGIVRVIGYGTIVFYDNSNSLLLLYLFIPAQIGSPFMERSKWKYPFS